MRFQEFRFRALLYIEKNEIKKKNTVIKLVTSIQDYRNGSDYKGKIDYYWMNK